MSAVILRLGSWIPDERANFWVLVVTAVAALWYGWLAYLNLRSDRTPIFIAAYTDSSTKIRNVGRGAGLNASLVTSEGNRLASLPTLAENESRTALINVNWTLGDAKFIFYQDVNGAWFATKCVGLGAGDSPEMPIANSFLGRIFNPPPSAQRAAPKISPYEYFVRRNRPWDPTNWILLLLHYIRKRRAENAIARMISTAVQNGSLTSPFTPSSVAEATKLDRIVADRFLPNHVAGNRDGEREYFVREGEGRFRLK